MNEVSIRVATAADARTILQLKREGMLKAYPNQALGLTREDILQKDFDSVAVIEKWQKRIEDGTNFRAWIAETANQAVGCCSAKKIEREIGGLFVTRTHQGRMLGKKLTNLALEWLGNGDIHLRVVSHNPIARIYKRFGFVEYDTEENTTIAPGKIVTQLLMRRKAIL